LHRGLVSSVPPFDLSLRHQLQQAHDEANIVAAFAFVGDAAVPFSSSSNPHAGRSDELPPPSRRPPLEFFGKTW
jgi:hypothetical protein